MRLLEPIIWCNHPSLTLIILPGWARAGGRAAHRPGPDPPTRRRTAASVSDTLNTSRPQIWPTNNRDDLMTRNLTKGWRVDWPQVECLLPKASSTEEEKRSLWANCTDWQLGLVCSCTDHSVAATGENIGVFRRKYHNTSTWRSLHSYPRCSRVGHDKDAPCAPRKSNAFGESCRELFQKPQNRRRSVNQLIGRRCRCWERSLNRPLTRMKYKIPEVKLYVRWWSMLWSMYMADFVVIRCVLEGYWMILKVCVPPHPQP